MKKILIFASGTPTGGGSGFEQFVEDTKTGVLNAEIVAVVTNYQGGGVEEKAKRLGIPCIFFEKPWEVAGYKKIAEQFRPNLIVLAGWLRLVSGLENYTVINEHPAPLPHYGGKGKYGPPLYTELLADYAAGILPHSELTYHVVNEEYDRGKTIFAHPVPIYPEDTIDTLSTRTKDFAHYLYGRVASNVLEGRSCDGLRVSLTE